jgi:hypothetical protein
MPLGRNHAAGGTDGTRMFVFGGRTGGNFVTNGFDDVQIYDPVRNTWVSTSDPGSTLARLPQARGGMGHAVWYQGEFYVMGGETLNGPGATPNNVYARVDVYNPTTNRWRLDADMPTPRHGIYPVLFQSRIFVAGGGIQAANSQSRFFDEFIRYGEAENEAPVVALVVRIGPGKARLRRILYSRIRRSRNRGWPIRAARAVARDFFSASERRRPVTGPHRLRSPLRREDVHEHRAPEALRALVRERGA